MKRFIALLALTLCLVPVAQAELSSAKSFAAAKAKAKSEKRLLFLMFTSVDCRHCRKFNDKVLSTPVFQSFAKDHLSVMSYDVDAYAGLPDAEHQLALSLEEKYGVEKMPAIVVYSPDGKELLRTQGYRGTEAEKIVAQLRSFLP
jgi:thioredoxin-related protein